MTAIDEWSYPDMRTKPGRSDVPLSHEERTMLRWMITDQIDYYRSAQKRYAAWPPTEEWDRAIGRAEGVLEKLGCRRKK